MGPPVNEKRALVAPVAPLGPVNTMGSDLHVNGPNCQLALRLSMILQRQWDMAIPTSPEQLRDLSGKRVKDYNEVLDILEKSRGDGLCADFEWTEEYLNTAGSTASELAHLLVNDKYDSPWVLRPAYAKLFVGEHMAQKPPTTFVSHPSFGDGAQDHTREVGSHSWDGREREKGQSEFSSATFGNTIPTIRPPLDLLLGIAGYVPICHDQGSVLLDDGALDELWVYEIRQHVRVSPTDKSAIAVFYGLTSGTYHQKSRPRQPLEVAEQALLALSRFNSAVLSLQESGLIGDSLPILWKVEIGLVETINMNLAQVKFLYNCVEAVVDYLKKESGREDLVEVTNRWNPYMDAIAEGAQGPANAVWMRTLAQAFVWLDWVLTQAFKLVGLAVTRVRATTGLDMRREAVTEHLPLPECFQDLRVAYEGLLCNLGARTFLSLTEGFDVCIDNVSSLGFITPSMIQTLHHTTICIQILCLGLQSFVQSHTGMPRFSLMDRDVQKIHLVGCTISGIRHTGDRIVAHLQDLSCFGDMIKGPVMVFREVPSSGLGDEFLAHYDRDSCDLLCSLEDIAYIWGGAQFEFADADTDEARTYVSKVHIGGGILYPVQHDGQLWHWMSEIDPAFPSTFEALEKSHPKASIHRQEKIRIGAVSINQGCPLSTGEGQRVICKMLRDHVKSLQAFAPHWELNSIQGGIQGGQYVVPQFMLGWNKIQGHTEKQNLLNPSNNALRPELSNLYGLQASLCTGLLHRVALQRLVASRMGSYIRTRSPRVKEWLKLEQDWKNSKAFDEADLKQWFLELPEELEEPAWMLVREILCQLQHTGVDHENMLRIGWAQENTALKCLKIKCSGQNSWAKILTDSPDIVTFACVEPVCIQSSTPGHKCLGKIPKSYDPSRPLQLHTQIRPLCVDHDSVVVSDDWRLQAGQNYWMGPKDLMLLAEANLKGGVWQLSVKRSTMPVHLFRRKNNRVMLRETNDEGAVECFVGVRETFAQGEAADLSVPLTVPIKP